MKILAENFGASAIVETVDSIAKKLEDKILSLSNYSYFLTIFPRIENILKNYDKIEPARNMLYSDISASGLDDIIIVDGNMWHTINNTGQIGAISEISKLIKEYFLLKETTGVSSPVKPESTSKSSWNYMIPVFAIILIGGVFGMKFLKKRAEKV